MPALHWQASCHASQAEVLSLPQKELGGHRSQGHARVRGRTRSPWHGVAKDGSWKAAHEFSGQESCHSGHISRIAGQLSQGLLSVSGE